MSVNTETERLINRLLTEITSIKSLMPDKEIAVINERLESILDQIQEIKRDASEVKSLVIDPDGGLASRLADTRNRVDNLSESQHDTDDSISELDKGVEVLRVEVEALKRFRDNATRALWILFASLAGIGLKILFNVSP